MDDNVLYDGPMEYAPYGRDVVAWRWFLNGHEVVVEITQSAYEAVRGEETGRVAEAARTRGLSEIERMLDWDVPNPYVSLSSDEIDDDTLAEIEAGLAGDPAAIRRLGVNRGWIALAEELRRHQERTLNRIVGKMFRQRAPEVDQREVDYARGVSDTIDYILALPERMRGGEA